MSALQAVKTSETTPKVSELDAAKLENAVLRIELLQLHLRSREAEANTLIQSLARPGYLLQRTPDGGWVYQPAPPTQEVS